MDGRDHHQSLVSGVFVAVIAVFTAAFLGDIVDLIVYILPSSWSSSFAHVEPASDTVITASGPGRGVSKPRRETGGAQIQDSKPADRLPTEVAPRVRPYAVPYGHDDPAASRVPEPPPAVASVPIEEPVPAAQGDQRLPTNAITATHDEQDDDPVAAGARMASEILLRAAQEQGAGRLARARELLEWVIKTFRDTPFANEAAQRLTVLTQEEAAQREKQAAGLLKQAISLEAQGKVDESRKMVRDIVALYEGTASSREARRRWQSQQQDDAAEVLRNTAAVDREQVATLLQRAAQEQTAGHLSQARGLLEWVVTTYRDTSFAEEAHNRLHDLTIAERNQHEKQADEILKKAISLQDSGKLEEARPLFYDLLTLYKGTPASAEAKRRQQQGLEIELNSEPVKALRDATALQRAGELAEAYTRLTAVVTRYPGTESAREAERRLREMKTANAQQISAVLQRAAQELAAGRPEKGRQLLEWVSAMYKGTSHGDEAYRQLQTLAKAERAKRDGEAATTLKQAISLQDQGKLSEALVLFHRILTEYATTPAGPEALRRQKEVEGILTRREATEQLRQALELDEAGQRSEARWLLEDTVRKYRNTPAALEAARRLERMGQTTGN